MESTLKEEYVDITIEREIIDKKMQLFLDTFSKMGVYACGGFARYCTSKRIQIPDYSDIDLYFSNMDSYNYFKKYIIKEEGILDLGDNGILSGEASFKKIHEPPPPDPITKNLKFNSEPVNDGNIVIEININYKKNSEKLARCKDKSIPIEYLKHINPNEDLSFSENLFEEYRREHIYKIMKKVRNNHTKTIGTIPSKCNRIRHHSIHKLNNNFDWIQKKIQLFPPTIFTTNVKDFYNLDDILESFDNTISSVGIDLSTMKARAHKYFLKDDVNGIIKLTKNAKEKNPINILKRIMKYIDKGYHVDIITLISLFENWSTYKNRDEILQLVNKIKMHKNGSSNQHECIDNLDDFFNISFEYLNIL